MLKTAIAICSIGFVASWFGSCAHAQPNKIEYELRERCGERAAQVFKTEYREVQNTDEGQMLINYRNHYSATLNKCFFLELTSITATRASPQHNAKMFRLFDINENKEYGSFYKRSDAGLPQDCNVLGKICRTEEEWNALIAPFMDEGQ